jgi:endonuclease/exonuclease/phosphatase family metal-dependent hydrolase
VLARGITAVVLVVTVLRLAGLERATALVPLLAFTPYVVPVAAAAALVAVAARAPRTAAVAVAAGLVLSACIVPRAVGGGGPHPRGPDLRVLTANIDNGLADKSDLVDLVRQERVDVLAIQEFTPRSREVLERRGLSELLPYEERAGRTGANGTAVYSRWPLRRLGNITGPTGHVQAEVAIDVPGAGPVRLTSVHTQAPDLSANGEWRTSLRQLPAADGNGPQVLAGDFNATLDHAELRRLLGRGWSDAADRTGDGLRGTWPSDDVSLPLVTIDHVLVSDGLGVARTAVFDVRASDHRALLAVVELPAA